MTNRKARAKQTYSVTTAVALGILLETAGRTNKFEMLAKLGQMDQQCNSMDLKGHHLLRLLEASHR